tara:strand:- start:2439 stop:2723 length:285 start_codon:yes stop_codon:yes gene_type:complete
MNDPTRMISQGLGAIPLLGVAKGSVGKFLSGATKGLLGIDLADQEIPFLSEITDGLTVAAGVGSLIASAFDNGGSEPEAPKETAPAEVGGSFGV